MQKIHIFEDEILEDESFEVFEKTKTQQAKNVLKTVLNVFFRAKI